MEVMLVFNFKNLEAIKNIDWKGILNEQVPKDTTSIIDDDDYQMDDDDSEQNNMTINCPIEDFILGERLKIYDEDNQEDAKVVIINYLDILHKEISDKNNTQKIIPKYRKDEQILRE